MATSGVAFHASARPRSP